jgi:type I restriction enzyme S subunit
MEAVPATAWPVTRLKYVSSLKGRLGWQGLTADEYRAEGPSVVSSAHFRAERVIWEMCPRVSWERYSQDKNIQLENGDLLLMKDGAALGKLAFVEGMSGPACLNSHLLLFRPKARAYWPKYLYYYCSTKYFQDYILVRGTGSTFLGVSQETIGNHPISLPPLDLQRAISDFLDSKTAAIDELIRMKERLIELLQERRQALITQAVTKGLDTNVSMKDSGVLWLGKIPAHWEVVQLRRKIRLQRGVDITKDIQTDGLVPVVSSGGVASYHNVVYAQGPGVVVGRKGSAGTVHWVASDFWPHDTTLWVQEFRGNARRYVYYKLIAMRLESYDTGSANPTVNRNLVHPVKVSWPPVSEQQRIAQYLDEALGAISLVEEQVSLQTIRLREYRQALISAAVTGQIDVTREAAA